MELKFGKFEENYGTELLCPKCNSNYLSHDKVQIFERSEDAELGLHATIQAGKMTMDTSLHGNPSSRRGGLSINFKCENCHAKLELTLAQHKGNTLFEITSVGEMPKGKTQ